MEPEVVYNLSKRRKLRNRKMLKCILLTLFLAAAANAAFSNGCYMKLYRSNEFQGPHVKLLKSHRLLNHSEKSLRTVGKCCWKIYT